ncbi:MAG TPA: 6-carboxytetrahydropterin synthase [Bacteroidales bacterium]|nr:6-carboxytetrahydropterin synthase [Bacteroidales bacterium]
MTTVRLTKEFKFEMAHALKGYDGPCRNIHGHSYELIITVKGSPVTDESSPKLGMVMDFGELKKIVRSSIIDEFDHALVINRASAGELQLLNSEIFGNAILVDYQPTSENFLIDFAGRIKPLLPAGISLHSMRLRETVTSYAEWFAEDNEE